MSYGIYTLANDVVYDQLVALLNSIEANAGEDIPVCVIPYNDQIDQVRAEIAKRPNVTLFDNHDSMAKWQDFATQAWSSHLRARQAWQERGITGIYRIERYRKYCCFDGNFDKFIFFDADTLLMAPLAFIYQKLDQYDWVVNDFQYKSAITYIFDCSEEELLKVFSPEIIKSKIFCSGWFASKKGMFDQSKIQFLLSHLNAGESNVMAWRDSDQTLLNYMVWRSGISYYNFAYHDVNNATGSHWSSAFQEVDHVLYDQGKRLTYLHYMSVPSSKFTELCQGHDVDIPYKELFLHYRYLNCPEQRPQTFVRPNKLTQIQNNFTQFIQQKVKNINSRISKINKS
jgi:hypothetical protein